MALQKARVQLLDPDTGKVIAEVDVLTSAPVVAYTNDNATVRDFRGIPKGTTFKETEEKTVQDVLDDILYPYTKPEISFITDNEGNQITEDTILYVEPIYQVMLNESEAPVLKKVIVAVGNKVAIGDNLTQALNNLGTQSAINIEVSNTDNIESVIDGIIKANNNVKNSTANNDLEMMGKDLSSLQTLIDQLEEMVKEQREQEEKEQESINKENMIDENTISNTVNEIE